MKKGTSYGVVIVEAEKSHFEEVAAGEENGGCKCGTSCSCTDCKCGK
ncbi:hypothetical protein L9G15_20345 [Shewanella sp. A3A]|uniref:Metallothionein n=1 Tax=Shewanella electrica TaxID=515560 RepID=A0ABT2FR01_9GAMM|nr:hypothetical protein [Shewanella ferrihydritica]MCH1927414.1 hypothetical protein [Shewanella electrica]MCH1932145.1 hypothetical protein [Shewanella shenzhenensis]MCJ0195708.1 hypothetical protein [Clostridioides difficile]MCJ0480018.1 hypothetical protein [Clostridioides difficile]